jgi:hypothetical protein
VQREIYGGGNQSAKAAEFWQTPRLFTIPAYAILADGLAEIGPRLVLQPPTLKIGSFSAFAPVTLASADLQSIAIFIVSSIESGRKDKLKRLQINVELGPAQLWILPS